MAGDCLALFARIPDRCVHLVCCDLPYGVTDCKWDRKIDSRLLWREYARVLRPRGAVLLFAQGRFCNELMNAAPAGWFRYDWIWDKRCASGFLNSHRMPMRAHETVLVFGRQIRYMPQGIRRLERVRVKPRNKSEVYRAVRKAAAQQHTGFPTTMLRFGRESGAKPAEKPVALLSFLIRTYTRRGDVVLDNSMGLGSTGVAAVRAGRNFIGMELDAGRFDVAAGRIAEAYA